MSEVQAEAERAMSELKSEAERAISAKDTELATLKSELAQVKDLLQKSESRIREFEEKIVSLSETKKREWQMEVLEPEIVSSEEPPVAHGIFKNNRAQTLADLERQAQAELARMGSRNAKSFFGLKK
ncbi:MAG: hypothetical protein J6R18_06525 [Kiritimatiellae bacterium]|nr:hypothetical protein [Kiritimatiellia bacterium]